MTQDPAHAKGLADLRVQIDQLDAQLLTLLNQRAHLAESVGDIKRAEGSVVFRPEREAQVIDSLQKANVGALKSDSLAFIWHERAYLLA